ncbi:MAG: hypothetical protein OFPI_23400 [Osedax symbiont Rs2]|nr:MAG: hypothetical protein OFPI_23400 [Osedax symbiont Rs2]
METDQYLMQRRAVEKKYSILCIDDESTNLKVLSSLLKDDYRLILAKSAAQGMKKTLELMPDLIILDVVMPQMSGFEMIEVLKNNPATTHIPVIFITGLQSVENEEKGLLLGGCDYIHKPFHHSIIRARVKNQIEIVRQRNLLEHIANIDSLTELNNRRKWVQDTDNLWLTSQLNNVPMVFGILDIDHFKSYNDSYGHQQGDIALRKISHALKRAMFEQHGKIYRCGGEEFYFYLPATSKEVQQILDHYISVVNELNIEHLHSRPAPRITVSIGAVKLVPSSDINLLMVMEQADKLLYQVKRGSRNAAKYTAIPSLVN